MASLSLAVEESVVRRRVEVWVPGIPQPQGSNRVFRNPKTKQVVITSANPNLRPWRLDVTTMALEAMGGDQPFQGPVRVEVVFSFPRPARHFGQRRGRPYLKSDAPYFSSTRPDLDKLARGIGDALKTARVYGDDNQVARLLVEKIFEDPSGARIVVEEL